MSWLSTRQWRQHKAFRIAPPRWPEAQRDDLAWYLNELAELTQPAEQEPVPTGDTLDDGSMATAATQLWRAQRKLAQGKPDSQSKQAARYLRTCAEALAEAGLTVQDHDGEPFHAGKSIEVLVYSEDPDVGAETVAETVRPAVYQHGRRIQTAQVIVAVPTADPEDSHA
ncbi:nucleotide exchange factor GrpE [Tenggerimyces flavus]|uniref:Nucleotide exchange factor GrpE n=1 Tax=Tenggerimyces flavus TaxID=1708749 RepID=A0ABV7Y4R5_9ACTN|nr:hypothetical protein [Tenggerimyces flavus]MBM7788353.1 hypothetical protein [Tenggerimyces flavus]